MATIVIIACDVDDCSAKVEDDQSFDRQLQRTIPRDKAKAEGWKQGRAWYAYRGELASVPLDFCPKHRDRAITTAAAWLKKYGDPREKADQ